MILLFFETLLVSLIFDSVGFIKVSYFTVVGYGLSVACIGIFLLIIGDNLTLGLIFSGILYILYGLRLAIFLLIRDLKNENYKLKISEERDNTKKVGIMVKLMVWISCALLYTCQTSPFIFRLKSSDKDGAIAYIGIVLSFLGFLLETVADFQKNNAKKNNPNRFVDSGLYKIVRCPNYFGELLFWTGNFLSGLIYDGVGQWIVASLGYICLILVMIFGTKKLEMRQNKSYGEDPEYQKYIKSTPILIPLLPLYSCIKKN
jgi:steroid 5-alpha reductase family enzyme